MTGNKEMSAGPSSMTARSVALTLLLIHTEHDDDLVTANTDELLDTADTSARQFGEQDHAVDVVMFQQLHVCAHFGDLSIAEPRLSANVSCRHFSQIQLMRTCFTLTMT